MSKRKQLVPQDDFSVTASNETPELHLNDLIQRLLAQESSVAVAEAII